MYYASEAIKYIAISVTRVFGRFVGFQGTRLACRGLFQECDTLKGENHKLKRNPLILNIKIIGTVFACRWLGAVFQCGATPSSLGLLGMLSHCDTHPASGNVF
jgi:hypothetical protein